MADAVICPRCRGRRTIFDAGSLFLGIGFPLAFLFDVIEGDDDGAITRQDCPTCDGDGWVRPPRAARSS